MGFREIHLGKNKNTKSVEETTGTQNNTVSDKEATAVHSNGAASSPLPAITSMPAGFKIGDSVKIKTICDSYRDSNWKLQYISTGPDVNLRLHHDEIVFEITCCRDDLLELIADAYGTHYLIYVHPEMIQMNKEPNKDNSFNNYNYRNYGYGTYSLPDGFNIGDTVKLTKKCNRYYDEHLKRHSIDFDTDMYFKNNFSSIIFKITGSKGNYLELTARENGRNYVIYVSPEVTQLYKKTNEDNGYNNSSYNYENYNSDSYSYGNANEDYCDYEDYDDSLSYIPISDYVYSSVEEVDEWCRTTEYDDGDTSWTNDFDILQSFYHDVDEINYFSSRRLLSMLYPDIYLPNAVKEKAFRILLYRAHHGDAESQYWVGVAAYQGLAGRSSDKRVAYIYIKLAEQNGFRKTDGYRKYFKNPTSKFIAERFHVNTSLFYLADDLNVENESDYSYNDDYDYNSYDDDDNYYDDDDDYDYGNYGSDSYKRGIGNGDTVRINQGVNRYWTDLYNKNSRVSGIPSDYFSTTWTVVNNDRNKYELEFTSGLIIKKTVRIVLCLQDITET